MNPVITRRKIVRQRSVEVKFIYQELAILLEKSEL